MPGKPDKSAPASEEVTLREVQPGDADECARIVFEAFAGIHDHHRFPRDFPTVDVAAGLIGAWIPHPHVWGVVAERDGRIVGSNFLDERDPIAGVGPITVDPQGQNSGVGRKLMEAVLERGKDARGIRLLQDAFHMRSLSLYSRLGFDVTAPCVVMSGTPAGAPDDGIEVRPMAADDVDACAELSRRVHGFERSGALRDSLQLFTPYVAVRDGHIAAYAATLTFWPMAHGVAEDDEAMTALLLGGAAAAEEPIALLVPIESPLFRWCLEQGLRSLKPMNVMSRGEYQEPRGAWFPSVIY